MKNENIIQDKSYMFALRIVKLYKYLVEVKKEYTLSKQLVRSGTSVGALSKKDFRYKLSLAYKEARETKYWIRLLNVSDYIESNLAESLLSDVEQILKILGKILMTTSPKGENHS